MNEEQKTAIQEAIETIKEFRKKASFEYKAATTNEDKEEWLSSISAIDSCLGVITDLLPKEREQIEQAYDEGYNNAIWECGTPKSTTAQDYYLKTFKPI